MGTQPGLSAGAQDYTAPVRRTTRLADDRTKSPPRSGWAAAGTGQRGGLKGSDNMAPAVLAEAVNVIDQEVCLLLYRGLRTLVRRATYRTLVSVLCKDHRRQTMHDDTTAFVGLDVHKEAIAIAVADPGRAAVRYLGAVRPALTPLTKALAHLGPPQSLALVYEAGPCGYGLARRLLKLGYRCEVVAPGKIPHRPGERIKTDRRDALTLASFARSAELTPVLIPDERGGAMRDLARAREAAVPGRLTA